MEHVHSLFPSISALVQFPIIAIGWLSSKANNTIHTAVSEGIKRALIRVKVGIVRCRGYNTHLLLYVHPYTAYR